MKFEHPPIYGGAKKNEDGTIDKSQAAIISDFEGKLLAKKFQEQTEKEEKKSKERFVWEKSLAIRYQELFDKEHKKGLSEHGKHELKKLERVMAVLQEE